MPIDYAPPSASARLGIATKANPVDGAIVSSYGLSQPVRLPRRFDVLAEQGYGQSAPCFHAINLIASGCAGIPWILYQRKGANRRGTEIDQHPLLDLMQRPNPTQGWGKLFEAYVSYLYIAGNSYVYANLPKKGAPVELWTMRPDRMRIKPDVKQYVAGYVYEVNGEHVDFDAASILHTKTFAPLDDWYGMSPLAVAARNIDVRNAGGDWNLALLQNSGRLPGFFVTKERLGDAQFSRMREQLIDRYTGSRNVGLPGLLDGGDITWQPAGVTPMDMDWSQMTLAQSRDIAITLGVPPEMLGDPQVKTYASYSEARASFYTETVLPLMDILRDELNRWLVPMYGANLWLDYDTEEIEALAPLRASRWAQVQAATFLTVNEKREATGYDAIPGGDVIILLNTNATLDEVTAEAVPEPVQPVKPPGAAVGGGATGQPANDASDTDEGAPTPAPDAAADAGASGMPSGDGAGATLDAGSKAHDPLDDILAGKVVQFRPKAARPPVSQRPSRYRRLTTRASG